MPLDCLWGSVYLVSQSVYYAPQIKFPTTPPELFSLLVGNSEFPHLEGTHKAGVTIIEIKVLY